MIFTEFRFLFFFLTVFCIYWTLSEHQHRKIWLLICSYLFYAAWNWRFLSLMLASTIIDYVVGLMISRPIIDDANPDCETKETNSTKNFDWNNLASKPINSRQRKLWLVLSLVGNLSILGFFKYYNFFTDSAANFLNWLGLPISFPILQVILPVGISFYTFQTLSYSLDIYRGKLKPTKKFWDFALFVSFFPQLVAGPIVRAAIFLPQLLTPKTFSQVEVRSCLMLFLVGYFKKACVADNLSPIVDKYFANPEMYTVASAWIGVISFIIQVYCDFSGYSDMAIASAGLLGYKLPLNFNFPYFASNITELWKRWHITMSNWFRDYLYVPLMRRREKKDRTKFFSYSNLIYTMLVTGLWHGAAWHFVVWGGLNGIALAVHKEWSTRLSPYKKLLPVRNALGVPLTFYFFSASGIFFRSEDFFSGLTIVKSFVFFNSPGTENLGLQAAWIFIPLVLLHWAAYKNWFTNWWRIVPNWSFAVIYGLFVSAILPLVRVAYQPFIYFQF
ncbi:MBOAT family O-acyltransferase [Moorena sp. SIO3H5]|uniref:MBOAT family O-acyltransferase n=1 Tax=Moorena sp. SIO3H5 TaxID=2607834 RepID=UPI0025E39AA0|nr:MBOAT family O-acyltransferase [Moorena sp. SIO3H5]